MDMLSEIFKTDLENMTPEQRIDWLTELLVCIEEGYSTDEAVALVTDAPWVGTIVH